jgi:hypothetical protein
MIAEKIRNTENLAVSSDFPVIAQEDVRCTNIALFLG